MGASSYMRDRKRIYQEAETRGRSFKKAALRHLDRDYDTEPIHRHRDRQHPHAAPCPAITTTSTTSTTSAAPAR